MPFVTSVGREIYFERHAGPAGAPVLVLLHGAGSNAATWWQQLGAFTTHFTCYTMDQRCFGRSVAPLSEFQLTQFVADVLALLDHEGIARATLLGQSLGGMVALTAALKAADRVARLVLCDSPLPIRHARLLKALEERVKNVAALTIEERSLGAWFRRERPQLATLYAQINHFNPNFYRQNSSAWQAAMQSLHADENLLAMEALQTVTCPTLLVVGEEDPIVPVEVMRDVQARIAGSELCVIQNAAHSAYFEQAEVFNERVLRFLSATAKAIR